MGRYLVELYLARTRAGDVGSATARARTAAAEVSRDDAHVRYLRSIFVPEDETWFLIYDAASAAAVRDAVERAALSCARIVEVVASD
jgi:hypothetical protein